MIELKNACVVVGSDAHELCLHTVAHVESLHKFVDCLFVHLLVGAGESLQSLVGMRISLATQNSLYGLCHHSPSVVEVGGNLLLVKDEFAQTHP